MKTPKLIPIDLTKGNGHTHPDIDLKKLYLAKAHGMYAIGRFNKQWYGLNFHGFYDAGLQFDTPGTNCSRWEALWEFKVK